MSVVKHDSFQPKIKVLKNANRLNHFLIDHDKTELRFCYFEYLTEKNHFNLPQKCVQMFEELLQYNKGNSKLLEAESLFGTIDHFVLSESTILTKEFTVRNETKLWQTYLLKCQKVQVEGELCVYGLILDVTEKFSKSSDGSQLDKLQSLGQLTSGVSHDFNNQLNGILGYVSLMKTITQDEDLLRYMDGIERAISHSTELTRQLLSFSHQTDAKKTNLNLIEVITDITSILKHTVDRRITIKTDVNMTECMVLGDDSQLHNAVLNLCLNARDAIKGNGEITLSLEKDYVEFVENNIVNFIFEPKEYAILKIKDTGTGISPELVKKIFKPFFTTKGMGKGTGMGLAAVANTVENHGGAITIDSVINEGTTFTLYIPCSLTASQKKEVKEIYQGTGHIMVIDDELCNVEITHTLLESFGYQVTSFSDPEVALSYYQDHYEQIDCILLDVIMPRMSGAEVFEALKGMNESCKVILLTGINEQVELDFILRHGIEAYVPKPVNQYELSYGIHKVLQEEYDTNGVKVEQLKALNTSLNLDVALSSIGNNTALYLKIAKRFRKRFYRALIEIEPLLLEDKSLAKHKIHTIKGLSLQLGADELYIYCKELEGAINHGLDSMAEFDIFSEEFSEVMDELALLETIIYA